MQPKHDTKRRRPESKLNKTREFSVIAAIRRAPIKQSRRFSFLFLFCVSIGHRYKFLHDFTVAAAKCTVKSRKENPQKLTQLSSRSHPRHFVGKETAQKDTIIDITSDSKVNSNFPNRWSPASLTFNNYYYLFLYLYIT